MPCTRKQRKVVHRRGERTLALIVLAGVGTQHSQAEGQLQCWPQLALAFDSARCFFLLRRPAAGHLLRVGLLNEPAYTGFQQSINCPHEVNGVGHEIAHLDAIEVVLNAVCD